MGLFMIPRTRWRMRTIDNKTEDGLSKVHIVLENVGITDVTDVDVTSNHEYSDAITFAEGEHKALVKRGESIGHGREARPAAAVTDGHTVEGSC